MKELGPKAMTTRSACMKSIGWLGPKAKYEHNDWLECINFLHNVCGMPYKDIAVMLGLSAQAIQHDFYSYNIKSLAKTRGGDHSSKVFLDGEGRKGTIKQHCFRRRLNYQSVYTRMRREMTDNNLTKQDALIIVLDSVKVRQKAKPKVVKPAKIEKHEPEREYAWHGKELQDRLEYLAMKAEKHQARPKKEKKRRHYLEPAMRQIKPRHMDYSSLIVRNLMVDGYDEKIAVCENKQEPENLPNEEWYR